MSTTVLLRKDSIVRTTIEVMNEQGVQAVSTKEIARREGITEGTIYKHFPQKKDLLISVLNYYEHIEREIFAFVEVMDETSIQKIIFLVDKIVTYYEENPEITAISQGLNELYYHPNLVLQILTILNKRNACFIRLIDEAKSRKEIRSEVNSEMFAEIIIGVIRESCLQWRFSNYIFSLSERCNLEIELLLNAFKPK